MWTYLPSAITSACSPVRGPLTLESGLLAQALAAGATWRSKRLPVKSWSRVCRTIPWMMRQCGRISQLSTLNPGEAISAWLRAASRARTSVTPAKAKASRKATAAACGSNSSGSFAVYDPNTSSWRMSQRSLFEDSTSFSGAWPGSGTMRNGRCSRRPRLALRTSESGGSALQGWPTPNTGDHKGPGNPPGRERDGKPRTAGDDDLPSRVELWPTPTVLDSTNTANATANRSEGSQHHAGVTLVDATKMWPTPDANVFQDGHNCTSEEWETRRQKLKETAGNGNGCGTPLAMASQLWMTPNVPNGRTMSAEDVLAKGQTATGKRQVPLESQTQTWATPTSRDWRDGAMETANVPTAGYLGRQVCRMEHWKTPMAAEAEKQASDKRDCLTDQIQTCHFSLPDQETEKPGAESSATAPNSPRRRRLNPLFVEWLMNLPIGWTDFAPLAMEWSSYRRQLHLLCCGSGCTRPPE